MSVTGSPAPASVVGGRYELECLVGRGGAGEVWRARHVTLDSHVAIKFLHGPLADRDSSRERFVNEARVTARLKTRHAVRVFDFGVTDDGRPYLVMELLEGETVGQRLKRLSRLSPHVTVRFLLQAARALSRAHALHIVHRDLKPENLVIVSDEEGHDESIKVLDFGVARLVRELASGASPRDAGVDREETIMATLTSTGLLGTPRYMAPEQIVCAPDLDFRADIWALGVVAFECLTGAPPYLGEGLPELFANIQCGVHARARDLAPELPESFDRWFDVACAIHPASRFASATVAAAELATALGEPRLLLTERASDPPSEPPRSMPPAAGVRASSLPPSHGSREAARRSSRPSPPPPPRSSARPVRDVITLASPRGAEGPFRAPDWRAPLDTQACIDAIPPFATIKGLFTLPMIVEARRRGIELGEVRARVLPFGDYPLVEHVRILVTCARTFYPELPIRVGLRKLGHHACRPFLESVMGKVLWSSAVDVAGGLEVAARAYALAAPASRVSVTRMETTRAELRMDGVYYFLDSNHIGVFEGILRACGKEGEVLIRPDGPASCDLRITWA